MIPIIISAAIFLLVFLVVGICLRPLTAVANERLDGYLSSVASPRGESGDAASTSFTDRVLRPALHTLGRGVGSLTPIGTLRTIRAKLDMAGNPSNYGVIEYLATKALSIALIIPVGLWAVSMLEMPQLARWLTMVVIIGVGLWLPDMVLQRIIETRQSDIRRSLPDVLDLLVISVEAGIGFDGAVQKVTEKTTGALNSELIRVLEEVRLGQSRVEALRAMGERTQVPDLISFVAAITQVDTMGVSIAKVLRTQANSARERRSQRAREMASKLPVKLLFPLVFFVFPSLFVVILAPGVIRFVELFKALGN